MIVMLLAGAAVSFMGGVGFTLAITRPEIRTDEEWIDRMARRDRRAAR